MPFNNISVLRGENETVRYEPWMLDELLKCVDDPIYFTKNYVYINEKDRGIIKFSLRDYQEDVINSFHKEKMIILKWPRQSGKSSCTIAYLLWYAVFHSNKTIAILANKLDLAKEQMENLKEMYMMLPEWLQPGIKIWNKRSIHFANGSKIICAATSKDGIRGMAINILYLDEFAFVPPHIADNFIASVFPTISSGKSTKLIITSTPNGLNSFFHMWDAAERGQSSFVPKSIPWNLPPGRDDKWAREMIKTMGDEIKFNQEYKSQFIGSQATLIDHTFLHKMIKESRQPLIIPNLPEYCKIWQLPISNREMEARNYEYVASLDSAMGMLLDNSVLQICLVKSNINITQVAKICSNEMDIETFCQKCIPLLKAYHNPVLIVEQNGPGVAAVNFFHNKIEYENLKHFDPKGVRLGLIPTTALKEYTAVFLKAYIQKRLLKLVDLDTVKELLSFGRKGQKQWAALGGNKDDHVMALMWIVYYCISPHYYGNVDEKSIDSIVNDATILLTKDSTDIETLAKINMNNPDFHRKELESGAKYIGTIDVEEENNSLPQTENPEEDPLAKDDDDESRGLMFRRR